MSPIVQVAMHNAYIERVPLIRFDHIEVWYQFKKTYRDMPGDFIFALMPHHVGGLRQRPIPTLVVRLVHAGVVGFALVT